MKPLKFAILAITVSLTAGCALLTTPPMEEPVRQDYVGSIFGNRKANVFSLTPERRIVLVVRDINTEKAPSGVMVCSEPPADVAQNIASSVRALAEASAKDTTGKSAGANAEFSRALGTSVTSLFYRSQGVQLYRDGLFSLCQAHMNGLISDAKDFWTKYLLLLDRSFALIAQEIPTVQALRSVDLVNQVTSTKTAVDAALQQAKEAQAASEKAAERAEEALTKIPKP